MYKKQWARTVWLLYMRNNTLHILYLNTYTNAKMKFKPQSGKKKNSVGENPCKSPLHWLLDHFRCVVLNLVVKLNLKTWCDAETLCLEEYSCKHWGTWHLFSIVICRDVNASRKMQKGLILFILIFIIFI